MIISNQFSLQFTVTPVAEEDHDIRDNTPVDESTALHFDMDHMGVESNNDTLTHNSITALLSSKFRVGYFFSCYLQQSAALCSFLQHFFMCRIWHCLTALASDLQYLSVIKRKWQLFAALSSISQWFIEFTSDCSIYQWLSDESIRTWRTRQIMNHAQINTQLWNVCTYRYFLVYWNVFLRSIRGCRKISYNIMIGESELYPFKYDTVLFILQITDT